MADHQPLLRRTPLFPNETLPSLLARLSQLNWLTTTYPLERLIRHRLTQRDIHHDHPARPRQAETYTVLSELTQLPLLGLYQATGHWFAAHLTPPGAAVPEGHLPNGAAVPMLLARNVLRDHLHTERHMQFCPHCLRERGYVPLDWMPLLVTACSEHCCLLVANCDRCAAPVSINDLIRGSCPHCERRYVNVPTVRLAADSLGIRSQAWLKHWSGLGADARPDQPLADQVSQAVYSLVSGLWRCLLLTPDLAVPDCDAALPGSFDDRGSQRSVPATNHIRMTTAIWALLDWPDHFHQLLDAYAQARGQTGIHGPNRRFGVLYSTYLEGQRYWQHPSCAFVQAAFNVYLARNSQSMMRMQNSSRYRDGADLRDQFTVVGMGEAARILQVSQKKVRRFAREGRLPTLCTTDGHRMLARQDVLALRDRWQRDFQGAEAVARFLGVPDITIRRLRQTGVLAAEHVGGGYWLYDGDAVRALRTEMVERTRPLPTLTGTPMRFKTAVFSLGRMAGGGIPGLLHLVRQGRLTPYHIRPETMRFDEMCFQAEAAQALFAEWRTGHFTP